MSERSYFSLRYAVPGYTFVFIVLIINFHLITQYLNNEIDRTIFVSLLSLISGTPIGLIISQLWWMIYQKYGPYCFWFRRKYENLRKPCDKLYHRLKNKSISQTEMQVVLDYVTHSLKKDDLRYEYLARRWDLWIILCSEIIAIISGLVVGIIVLGFLGFDIIAIILSPYFWEHNWIHVTVIAITTLLIIEILRRGQGRILREIDIMADAIINKTDVDLRKVFPEYFGNKDC